MKAVITERERYLLNPYEPVLYAYKESMKISAFTSSDDFKIEIFSRDGLNIPLNSDIEVEITLKVIPKTTFVKTFK